MVQQQSAAGDSLVRAGDFARKRRLGRERRIAVVACVAALLTSFGPPAQGGVQDGGKNRDVTPQYADDAEHFKYASIGTEDTGGIPYWVWLALPRVFPELLPGGGKGGYASVGMIFEPGKGNPDTQLPVGFSKKDVTLAPGVTIPSVGMNCALCHTTTVRGPQDYTPRLYVGAPAQQLNMQGYLRFLGRCGEDDRFTPDILMEAISKLVTLAPEEQKLYHDKIIPSTRDHLNLLALGSAWMKLRPNWGRGRIDPFNSVKFNVLKLPQDRTIGNADMVPVWNMRAREGLVFHWDGLNSDLQEVVLSSAIGDGTAKDSLNPDSANFDSLKRIEKFIRSLPPPKYPFTVDTDKAERGRKIFYETTYYDQKQTCAQCHAFGGERTGKVVPIDEIKTDEQRHLLWPQKAADAYNAYASDKPWKFSHFVGTADVPGGGYVAVPLDGIWLRGPFLHNGSVPTLRDLLKKQEDRPKSFWRGSDRFNAKDVGFDHSSEEDGKLGRVNTFYDTTTTGNGNGGHTYGTDLPGADKDAVVEYMKTL
jgi:hypothetical protein